MRRIWIAGLLLLAAGAAAPVGAQQSDGDAEARQASVDLPAELDRVLRDYERHWSGGNAAELSALFVERGLIVRDGRWIRGRDAIQQAYRSASGPLRLRAIEYATDGAAGYIVGAYGYGAAGPVQDLGLFVLTLRFESGRWLIVSDMDRSGAG